MTKDIYDYAIIGAGMSGASVAYELTCQGKNVLILDKEQQAGFHSTGRSAAFFAETYGNQCVRNLTKASREFFEKPPANFCESELFSNKGSMFIAREEQMLHLEQFYKEVSLVSSQVKIYDQQFALDKVSRLIPQQVAGCVWDPDSQEIDVATMHQGYLKLAKQQGATIQLDSVLEKLNKCENHWQLCTPKQTFAAKVIINAAGAWADQVAVLAGIKPVGLVPKKRTVCVIPIDSGIDVNDWPLVIDVAEQFYFKPEGGNLLISPADETPVEPMDAYTEMMDVALAVERVTSALDIEVTRVSHEWAGLRTFAKDKSPVVGFADTDKNFFWLAGQGGYGIQLAPATAKLAASILLEQSLPEEMVAVEFNLDEISPDRF